MQHYKDTIISQYANSPTINQLIESMNDYIDPRASLQAFRELVWDIDSASGYGLDIWGKIVGVKRALVILPGKQFIGFNEAISYQPFNQALFYDGGLNYQHQLPDDEYRTLIKIKALSNISATNVPALNLLLRQLFPGHACWVLDTGDMKITYVFEFSLSTKEYEILTQSGVMPKPAGVQVSILQLADLFGFYEADDASYQPFDHGFYLDTLDLP